MPNKRRSQTKKLRHALPGTPQPKQIEFFTAKQKYVAYGGARGGGKSWALRRKLVLMCARFAGISILLLRRSYTELRDNHIRQLLSELDGIAAYHDTRKVFTFPNGSRIRLGYLDSESDTLRYQGQEFDVIAIDEATQFTEYQFQTLKACLRGTNGFPKRMYLTCNPGGVGHGWVKRLFIDRDYRAGEKPSDYAFIQALVYDNRALLDADPDYLDRLQSLPTALREAWLNGQWNEFDGQFFREFDYDVHTCAPRPLPEDCERYCAIDYGFDMLAAVFVAVTKDGRAFVYDEVHESGLIVSEAAEAIKPHAKGVRTYFAPSDLWSRQKDSGKSMASLFADNGIYLTRLQSSRIDGWMCLREWLKKDENGVSPMTISRVCVNLIRTLPLLLHDKDHTGDASTEPHSVTHAPDALRYFASAMPYKAVRYTTVAESHREKLTDRCHAPGENAVRFIGRAI